MLSPSLLGCQQAALAARSCRWRLSALSRIAAAIHRTARLVDRAALIYRIAVEPVANAKPAARSPPVRHPLALAEPCGLNITTTFGMAVRWRWWRRSCRVGAKSSIT